MKRVFILGAGSSIGHSKGIFPTIDTFFKVAQNNDLGIDIAGEYKAIIDYIKDRTGRDLLKKPDAFDIEAFFTYLEIELERTASPELIKMREQLLNFIQRVLPGLSVKLKSKNSEVNLRYQVPFLESPPEQIPPNTSHQQSNLPQNSK